MRSHSPPDSHRRFITLAAATLLVVVALAALLNRAVNPYSLFARDWLTSKYKPETFTHLRLVKAAQVRHYKPQGLILGSSRAETGLAPDHRSWSAQPVFNLGLSEAGIYEIQRYFQHACAVAPVKQAVILLDYSAFTSGGGTAPDFREERLAAHPDGTPNLTPLWSDYFVALASWDALAGSLATLSGSPGEKQYLPDGSRDAKAENDRVLAKGGAAKAFAAYEKKLLASLGGPPKTIGEEELRALRVILDSARRQNVDIRLAIAPMHVRYLEILDMDHQWPVYENWKRRVVQLVEEEAAASGKTPFILVDFSGYNEFTTEKVPAQGLATYYLEASHFTKRLGEILLDRLLGSRDGLTKAAPGSFGVLLTGANIDSHLQAIRTERELYRRNHAAEIADLRSASP